MCSYRQLLLWQQARGLAAQVYHATAGLSTDDHFDLATRMRTAALAVPVEIATHYCCDGTLFLRGIERATDAIVQLEHLVLLAAHLHCWPNTRTRAIARNITDLRNHLRAFLHSLAPPRQMI